MDGDISTISELIDKLITTNVKLYNVMEETGTLAKKTNHTQADMVKLGQLNLQNVELVKNRSKLKSAIDSKINQAIIAGSADVLNEVKSYGK